MAAEAQIDESEQTPPVYEHIHEDPEYHQLRKAFRGFAFPVTVAFLVWYLLYVVLSAFALKQQTVNGKVSNVKTGLGDFLSTPVIGEHINVALIFGLLQFVTTFLIAFLYSRHASKNLDPLAESLNAKAVKFSQPGTSGFKRTPGRRKQKGTGK